MKGGKKAAIKFLSELKLFVGGGSYGGAKSLACHPPSTSHRFMARDKRLKIGINDGFCRLSVGIEDVNDLINDLNQALLKA
jgi:cystathionine beta-lyase/cystathionine gamma-synthase